MSTAIPADHPAHILGIPDEDDAPAYLDVHIVGGHRLMDAPSLMRWRADITVRRDSENR